MTNEQLAALYVELLDMYVEDFPVEEASTSSFEQKTGIINKIKSGAVSKTDLQFIEPVFMYGHIDIHRYITPKKRFIWF